MDLAKRLKEIEEHFSSISREEFERNLKLAGFGEITSADSEGMELMPLDYSAQYYQRVMHDS